jgi:phosphoribosyl 1,2-cyclic phosphodiesterase
VIVIATDLGSTNEAVAQAIAQADLVVLEANHDVDMLHNGRYPVHLRRRVSGPTGHLSNDQAASTLGRYVKSDDVEVWLAHLSKENNSPAVAARTVRTALSRVGLAALTLGIAVRDRPSLRWTGLGRPRQLSLFGTEGA